MKIGLLFGSFNPVHTGHLIVAEHMLDFAGLDEVWFVVSPHNPLKDKRSLADAKDRLEMVRLAVRGNPRLRACDIEFRLPQPSFTIHTLHKLSAVRPKDTFCLIMGTDTLDTLRRWKNFREILNGYRLYVYPRGKVKFPAFRKHPSVRLFDSPGILISASFIRSCIRRGAGMRYLVPEKVRAYIRKKGLYR